MARRDVIAIGASAGGIEAIKEVLGSIPGEGLDAAVFVVLHIPSTGGEALGQIFDRAGPMRATIARDGEAIQPGRVYVAAADHHLVMVDGHVGVRRGPRDNGHRPSVDALFRSAARYYGPRAISVVLSGTLDDGTAGSYAVRRQGGIVVAQDPADAMYAGMPQNLIERVPPDHVLPAREIGPLLAKLVAEEVEDDVPPAPEEYVREVLMMETDDGALDGAHPGIPSPWPCPDCDGVLWTIDEGDVLRFRCRVGHGWSTEALVNRQGAQVETALWIALRSLEDRAALSRTLAERAEAAARNLSAKRFRDDQRDLHESIGILRNLIEEMGSRPNPTEPSNG
jgi:two-component system chemotaxis response regulator CheB